MTVLAYRSLPRTQMGVEVGKRDNFQHEDPICCTYVLLKVYHSQTEESESLNQTSVSMAHLSPIGQIYKSCSRHPSHTHM